VFPVTTTSSITSPSPTRNSRVTVPLN
jgi:hypothetical protein